MTEEFKYKISADSEGDKNYMEMDFPGFWPTWAIATGDNKKAYWEFDLCSKDGMDMHFQIPYTLSADVLETKFLQCVEKFKRQDKF